MKSASTSSVDLPPTPSGDSTELPFVVVAPELLDLNPVVIREPDETEAEYRSRCDLLAILLDQSEANRLPTGHA
jgi:hypothetical protein